MIHTVSFFNTSPDIYLRSGTIVPYPFNTPQEYDLPYYWIEGDFGGLYPLANSETVKIKTRMGISLNAFYSLFDLNIIFFGHFEADQGLILDYFIINTLNFPFDLSFMLLSFEFIIAISLILYQRKALMSTSDLRISGYNRLRKI